jgi:signal transduction histidine kinase
VQQNVDTERLAFDENYPAAIEAVHRLDEAISAYQSASREQVRELMQTQVRLTALLALLALGAAGIVLWIILRLRTLARDLSHLVRVRDEILGIVSHDLRSPLTTITLSTQLIPGSPPEEQKEYADTILATTRRMERLIQDLLDATKIETSELSIKRDVVDPRSVTREVVASHEPIAASKKITFEAEIDDELPPISGDGDRLAQALSNLIGNAFKFTPEGGTVRLSVARHDGKVRFEVADSGPGISPSDLPHLFEPFWQAKKTAHLGAGLGLKITRAIVEAHQGSIDVRNLPQGGACFRFEVPAE